MKKVDLDYTTLAMVNLYTPLKVKSVSNLTVSRNLGVIGFKDVWGMGSNIYLPTEKVNYKRFILKSNSAGFFNYQQN